VSHAPLNKELTIPMPAKKLKGVSRKKIDAKVSEHATWTVWRGRLVPGPGRPNNVKSLFQVVAEKVPFECLNAVEKDMIERELTTSGIYLAHDSMGAARYAGRGDIFGRLRQRKKAQTLELAYFSFYVIPVKQHEREVETLLIRAASHLLSFNQRKKRPTILPGNINDYEPGTYFYERQYKKGKKAKKK
jgi:hypothetical protein